MQEGRAFCLRCRRVESLCFCDEIRPVSTRLDWVIAQHPRERKRTVGTARIAHLGLKSSQILCDFDLEGDPRVGALLDDRTRSCVVLYPGVDALDLSALSMKERSEKLNTQLTVFVIDGTWATARVLLARNPRIAALPRISFNSQSPSEYGFRRQPNEQCLSTVEAVCRLIELMEPEVDPSPLMQVFRKMVKGQLQYTQT